MIQYLPSSFFAVPFTHPLKRGMEVDRIIAVYGVILPDADRFVLNLQTGPDHGADIALHISYRIPEAVVVFNTKRNGDWENEERVHQVPVHRGQHFQMLINIRPNKFKVAINGQHFAEFHHRMPPHMITFVRAEGDVQINTITGVKMPNEPEHVVYNPEIPLVQNIGSIFPGRLIRVRGTIPHDVYRFAFNLMDGADKDNNIIPLHVSVRPNPSEMLVELNSKRHGSWEQGNQIRPCPVRPGQAFELLILVDRENYKIAFNGQHFTEYYHRYPLESVNHIRLDGSVTINKISFEGHPTEGINFVPMPPPAEDYFHPHAYEAAGNQFVFANPYPIY